MSRITHAIFRLHVSLAATIMPLAVRLLPLRWLLRLLDPRWLRLYRSVSPQAMREAVDRRLARPRMMVRRACLRKGLVLFHFLRLSGRPAVIRFAVYATANGAARRHAHCWVELDGEMLGEPPREPAALILERG